MDYPSHLESAIHASRLAARLLISAFRADRSALVLETKSSDADLVTVTDKACQEAIFTFLRGLYPHYAFFGEEDDHSASKMAYGKDRPTCMIIPTPNGHWERTLTFPCASRDRLAINGTPVLGVVNNPEADEVIGAHTNATQINLRTMELQDLPIPQRLPLISAAPLKPDLSNALVHTEYGSDRRPHIVQAKLATISALLQVPIRGIRSAGSAALSMCAVARSSVDIFYEEGIHAWDVCAGAVLVRESGGYVANFRSRPKLPDVDPNEDFDLRDRTVIAVRSVLGKNADEAEERAAREAVLATMRKFSVLGMVGLERD
ncbi:Inositol monophosphatase 2 [Gonapodya sp. JEL0774]|nr:Inositol monophosphatase 2 [Gonapodya sp. JEL0774]